MPVAAGVLSALCLLSCTSQYKKVAVTSFGLVSVTPHGFRSAGAVAEIGIHNPAGTFTVKDLEAVVKYNADTVGFLNAEPVRIAPRCDSLYRLNLSGTLAESFNVIRLLPLLRGQGYTGITADVSGRAVLPSGAGRKFAYKDIPVDGYLKKLQ